MVLMTVSCSRLLCSQKDGSLQKGRRVTVKRRWRIDKIGQANKEHQGEGEHALRHDCTTTRWHDCARWLGCVMARPHDRTITSRLQICTFVPPPDWHLTPYPRGTRPGFTWGPGAAISESHHQNSRFTLLITLQLAYELRQIICKKSL